MDLSPVGQLELMMAQVIGLQVVVGLVTALGLYLLEGYQALRPMDLENPCFGGWGYEKCPIRPFIRGNFPGDFLWTASSKPRSWPI